MESVRVHARRSGPTRQVVQRKRQAVLHGQLRRFSSPQSEGEPVQCADRGDAQRGSVGHQHRGARPAHGTAVPGQHDSEEPDGSDLACVPEVLPRTQCSGCGTGEQLPWSESKPHGQKPVHHTHRLHTELEVDVVRALQLDPRKHLYRRALSQRLDREHHGSAGRHRQCPRADDDAGERVPDWRQFVLQPFGWRAEQRAESDCRGRAAAADRRSARCVGHAEHRHQRILGLRR